MQVSGASRIEQPGARLDEHSRRIAVDVRRQAELTRQHDGATRAVVQQDGRAVAAVVRLATLRFPAAVALAQAERHLAQHVPVVRQHFGLEHFDVPGS